MRPRTTSLCAALLAGVALAAPRQADAQAKKPELLDYGLVQRTLPKLSELGEKSHGNATALHNLVDKLETGLTTPEQKEVRGEIRAEIASLMATKRKTVALLRDVLDLPVSPRSDEEVMEIIHARDLIGLDWNDVTFRKCVNDLSGALGIRIRMAYHVVQMNRVTMRFRRAPASTVLGSLCNYFRLRYTVEDGEVILYKKLTPNEERFLEYQKKHPDVKLKYWEREDASGEYKKEKR